LADLYAVGVVGASPPIWRFAHRPQAGLGGLGTHLMFVTFLIMLASVFTFCGKPSARVFCDAVVVVGFDLARFGRRIMPRGESGADRPQLPWQRIRSQASITTFTYKTKIVRGACECGAIRGVGKTLDFAMRYQANTAPPLFVCSSGPARSHRAGLQTQMQDDQERERFFYMQNASRRTPGLSMLCGDDAVTHTIVDITAHNRRVRLDPRRAGTPGTG